MYIQCVVVGRAHVYVAAGNYRGLPSLQWLTQLPMEALTVACVCPGKGQYRRQHLLE